MKYKSISDETLKVISNLAWNRFPDQNEKDMSDFRYGFIEGYKLAMKNEVE